MLHDCPSCSIHLTDRRQHIIGRRHRKFASDDSNFAALDGVLSKVRRRTLQEVAAERQAWNIPHYRLNAEDVLPSEDMAVEDIQWDDWVENDEIV